MTLKGKKVLVTGGARRIGAEICQGFASQGAEILIHYNTSSGEAEKLQEKLQSQKIKAHIYQADLLQVSQIKAMARKILKEKGGIDILVNNAAIFFPTSLETTSEKDWDQLMTVNLKAPYFLAQALAPAMKKNGWGRIINIADWSGLRPYRDYLPYCISKSGLITLTQGLAKTLAPEVLVTAVCPGPILPPPDFRESEKKGVARKTLVGHWGKPEDIAKMVVFLAESDFITGSYHLVDGGESLKS